MINRWPKPWRVYNGRLRPAPFDVRVIEIRDAGGKVVIPWSGFDQLDGSHTAKLRLARQIVKAVNERGRT